jgi:hypothetical protein
LYALLIILAFHFIHGNPQKTRHRVCGRTVLRVAWRCWVRITLNQVSQLGFEVAPGSRWRWCSPLDVCRYKRRAHAREAFSAVSVVICGASAALAISARQAAADHNNERFKLWIGGRQEILAVRTG